MEYPHGSRQCFPIEAPKLTPFVYRFTAERLRAKMLTVNNCASRTPNTMNQVLSIKEETYKEVEKRKHKRNYRGRHRREVGECYHGFLPNMSHFFIAAAGSTFSFFSVLSRFFSVVFSEVFSVAFSGASSMACSPLRLRASCSSSSSPLNTLPAPPRPAYWAPELSRRGTLYTRAHC